MEENTHISKEVADRIFQEGQNMLAFAPDNKWSYIQGATAYAQWKTKYDELCERYKALDQAMFQLQQEQLKTQPGAVWVKASTKPEHNVGVLVFIPGEDNHITSGMWDVSNKWVSLDEYRTPEEEVTHWMQLPAFPEGHERDVLSDEWVSTLKAIAKEELSKRPSKEGNKSFEYFLGELQSRTDRILRDKGASSKEVYDAINDVMNELRPIFTFDRHESPAAGREEDAVSFAEWIREAGIEPTFGNKWVDFSKSKDNRYTTSELYAIFKKQKEK